MSNNHDLRQEARVRSHARRLGYSLRRSRQRANVPNVDNHGEFMLVDDRNIIVLGQRFDADLDEVEAFLKP